MHMLANTSRQFLTVAAAVFPVLILGCGRHDELRMSRAAYLDKCKGAWAGQMIGVCYGEPYQFRWNGVPVLEPIPPWSPERIEGALRQDDVYVELTFLQAIEEHGLDVTSEQAGRAFARTEYPLWHANLFGRSNVRRGIMPPLSGHPEYNRHADDIDFQIEADLFGILCPGLPRESNRLCDVFGHIMNFGDGVYGGMFVAGMYTAAFFESDDVLEVVRWGLACIPKTSAYHECITDTIQWWRENPDDWLATWRLIEEKWNDDLDCIPGNPHNIDARINGAYIVVGLLYGQGDFLKTIEICTRCGQDADSSTANAGGVIGCMRGFDALGPDLVGGIDDIRTGTFLGTRYSFDILVTTCQQTAEAVIRRAGGVVEGDAYTIPIQRPSPPPGLEQWKDEAAAILLPVTEHEVNLWDSRWQPTQVSGHFQGGFYPSAYGRTNMLAITPIHPDMPAAIQASLRVPATENPRLCINVASDQQHGPFMLRVLFDDQLMLERLVDTNGNALEIPVEVNAQAGDSVSVRLEFHADDWSVETAYLGEVEIK